MEKQMNIKQLVRISLPKWKQLDEESMIVQRLNSITNQTYKVSAQGFDPVIFRKFGESISNIFLSRQSQASIYQSISTAGLGPIILYACGAFRIEEYIPSIGLQIGQMLQPESIKKMAFAMRQFHQLKPIGPGISNSCLIRKILVENGSKLIQNCRQKLEKCITTEEQQQIVQILKQWISENQLLFIDQLTAQLQDQGLKFCHNDLLANNVLVRQPSGEFVLIDYEYASYNYPIYDLAYYLNESSVDLNYPNPPYFQIFPSAQPEVKRHFLEAYAIAGLGAIEFIQNYENHRQSATISEEITKLEKQLPIGEMLAHMIWGTWAILMLQDPLIKLDKLAFAKYRYDQYIKIKAAL